MRYTPEFFGITRVGDFFDAMAGHNEAENERFKSLAELVRTSTAKLWNIQVPREDKLTEEELWPFPWDKKVPVVKIDDEKKKEIEDLHEKILMKDSSDGNSDIKS